MIGPDGWLIHKAGRGWYRPNAQGYTMNAADAGRYTYDDAMSYSHPNGIDGPRDGLTIKHESNLPSLRADLAPQAVRVKPLVWNGFVAGNYRIEVEKGGIANLWYYSAAMAEDEEPTMMKGGYLTLVSVDDLKAAAQADHDARIFAALDLTPDPRIAALVEAAKRAVERMDRHGLSGGLVSDIRAALAALKGGA